MPDVVRAMMRDPLVFSAGTVEENPALKVWLALMLLPHGQIACDTILTDTDTADEGLLSSSDAVADIRIITDFKFRKKQDEKPELRDSIQSLIARLLCTIWCREFHPSDFTSLPHCLRSRCLWTED